MSAIISDVRLPEPVEGKYPWQKITEAIVYSEPWTVNETQLQTLLKQGSIVFCEECEVYHPVPYLRIEHLRQVLGYVVWTGSAVHKPRPGNPYNRYLGRSSYDKPW